MYRYQLVVLWGLCVAGQAAASSSAEKLFDKINQDFGAIPRGQMLKHSFRIVNRTGGRVHIAGVRVSCGCTAARALQNELEPGAESAILAQMDSRRFSGKKTVTIYVRFDYPRWDEARLSVTANSRDDITVSPESLSFGRIQRGSPASATATVALRGHRHLQLLDSKCASPYVETKTEEQFRDTDEVRYLITARVRPDLPVGRWHTDVCLTMNDSTAMHIRVPLTVEIEPALSVSPLVAEFGELGLGDEAERKVVIRSAKAFRITSVGPSDRTLRCHDNQPGAKLVHVLTIRYTPSQPGVLDKTLNIATDTNEEAKLVVRASVGVK
jgi:Protein of unknown function (DUF1573)